MDLRTNFPVIDALQASNWNRQYFRSLVDAGFDAVHATLAFWQDSRETLKTVGRWNRWFRDHEDLILPVRSVDDIEHANETGRTGIILGFQNSSPIEDDLSLVEVFHSLGVRIMQLTYNNQSLLGAGCYETDDSGITNFGKNVIREMNRLGMIVDMSHTSERTCFEAIEFSERPVAITHANPLSFHNVVRNKSDELLIELAHSGGMLGFSLYPLHLANGSDCTRDEFCQMVAKTAELMGVEHIGIGSDLCLGWQSDYLEYMRSGTWRFAKEFDDEISELVVWPDYPTWFQHAGDIRNVHEGLRKAGFTQDERNLIMGGNWFQFFRYGFLQA